MKKRIFGFIPFALTVVAASLFANPLFASVPKPEIGKLIPDYTFTHVNHYKSKSVSISDFRGRWLFLEFWSNGCAGCVRTFPKTNELQQEFREKTTWLLVGRNSLVSQKTHNAGEQLYEKLSSRHQYELVTAYDSVLFNDWDVPFVPYVLVIDPYGVLRYFTTPECFSSERVRHLLNNEPVEFYDSTNDRGTIVSPVQLLENGKPIVSSLLTNWNGERGDWDIINDFARRSSRVSSIQMTRVTLTDLYNTAYFGQREFTNTFDSLYGSIYPYPILQLKDTARFVSDFGLGIGMYNYFLRMPPERITSESLMTEMQSDLKRAFGYSAHVEVKSVPVWKLIAEPAAIKKIKSKNKVIYNSTFERVYAGGFWITNTSFKDFFWTLTSYQVHAGRYVFIDSTGIADNVDITIDADLTDLNDIQHALTKYHMHFERGVMPMKVLVIGD